MSENSSITLEESQIQDYLDIAFSNGFSKGTANVSPHDMVKLRGLLKYYAKKPHPFRACVKDNRKRFGPRTEAVCAVLKDLIRGTTKWRSTERHKNLSEEELSEFILHYEDFAEGQIDEFVNWASNLTDEDVNMIITSHEEEDMKEETVEFAAGDIAWTSDGSWNDIRAQLETQLNDHTQYGMDYWVVDVNNGSALVCEKGSDYYVVPFSVDKKGEVTLSQESDWKPVEKAWVESNLNMSDLNESIAEVFFTEAGDSKADKDGLIWKTFLREGKWAYSPKDGKAIAKPLTIVKSGSSDPVKNVVSMADIKKNFEVGSFQHVTVPLSHEDKVNENTGFVKKLRFGKDEKGRATLEAAIDFTEPDIKEKIERGTIPNVSAGIHWNHVNKETGKKFLASMGHLALTTKPWIGEMKPFGVNASENIKVVTFSEEPHTSPEDSSGGGESKVAVVETEEAVIVDTFLQEIGLSEDEVKARLSRYEELERDVKKNRIDESIRKWEAEKKSPALIKEASAILMADEGAAVLELSEDGKTESLTASDIVERLVAAAPTVSLADDPITEEDAVGERAADDTTDENLSEAVKSEARRLWLYEHVDEEDAIAEAQRRLSTETTE